MQSGRRGFLGLLGAAGLSAALARGEQAAAEADSGKIPNHGAPDPRDIEAVLRLQVFLDRSNFGPGKVDGALGEFTRKALDCYNTTRGLPPGDYSPAMEGAEKVAALAGYTVRDEDAEWVDPKLPADPASQAKQKRLSYRRISEFVAERFHTDEKWLARANPGVDLAALKPGDDLVVPGVEPFQIEDLRQGQTWKEDPAFAGRAAVLDTAYRFVCFFEAGKMLAGFPITPGPEKTIRRGDWKVVVMQAWPHFRWDKAMLDHGQRSKDFHLLPPGPNSPVGVLWAGLNRPGIGMHGTSSPETIGRAQSAGCFRLANWDVVRLPGLIRPGCPVVVR